MKDHQIRRAIFPGTFDPITNGHLDIVSRAAILFDELIVAVGENPGKESLFDQDERAEMVRWVVADIPDVRVVTYSGLTVNAAAKAHANVILRGVRGSSDLHTEFEMACMNRGVSGIETLFMMTSPEHSFISSTLIKQIAQSHGDVSIMVPQKVVAQLTARCSKQA